MTVDFKFGIGDVVWTLVVDEEGMVVVDKMKVVACYFHNDGKAYFGEDGEEWREGMLYASKREALEAALVMEE